MCLMVVDERVNKDSGKEMRNGGQGDRGMLLPLLWVSAPGKILLLPTESLNGDHVDCPDSSDQWPPA